MGRGNVDDVDGQINKNKILNLSEYALNEYFINLGAYPPRSSFFVLCRERHWRFWISPSPQMMF